MDQQPAKEATENIELTKEVIEKKVVSEKKRPKRHPLSYDNDTETTVVRF